MKQFQSILLILLSIAVAVLFFLQFSGKKGTQSSTKHNSKDSNVLVTQQLRVAYIDLDTIKEYYTYFKLKNDEIENEKQKIESEVQSGLGKLEKDRINFLKRGEAITQIEAEKFQQEYQNRYQQIGVKRENLLNQHLNNQAKALDDIQKRINDYLNDYNKTAKYNFIFSTGEGNLTLYYKDSAFNITKDVVKGLNSAYELSKKK